jgi:MoxR-like ATPase
MSSARMIFQPKTGEFTPHRGPIFANLVLADEINRAPAKVQSALLEAMQERQVTIGGQTHPLPRPFFVHGHAESRSSRRAPTRCPRRRPTASSSS